MNILMLFHDFADLDESTHYWFQLQTIYTMDLTHELIQNNSVKTVKIELSHKVPLSSNIALWKLSVSLLNMLKCFFKIAWQNVQFFQGGLSTFLY